MCGRYTLHLADLSVLVSVLGVRHLRVPGWQPRYNIAPTQLAPVVRRRGRTTELELELLRFGLVPAYARGQAGARSKAPSMWVNAKVETVAKLGAFRAAYQRRRCIVPATGFFEWMPAQGQRPKQPMWIHPREGSVLAFAGIYEPGVDEHGEVTDTFAILTTAPTPELREVHDRMPLVLDQDGIERWLRADPPSPEALAELAGEVSAIPLAIDAVSSAVSSPRNDDPRCIEPLPAGAAAESAAQAVAQLDLFQTPEASPRALTSGKRRAH
jgi:putative SOS response-associated peptidase YedK